MTFPPSADRVEPKLTVRDRIVDKLGRAQVRGERLAAQLVNLQKERDRIEEKIKRLRTAMDVLSTIDELEPEGGGPDAG